MGIYEEAVKLDVNQDRVMAAQAYEKANKESHVPVASYINLACLYWLSTDFGALVTYDFRLLASTRMLQVLDEACERYDELPELTFWKLHIAYIDLGGDSFLDKALTLVQLPSSTLVPYFYIYINTKDPAYLPQARELITLSRAELTTKSRYILSMLDREDDPLI
jgi:hypothetical protein